MTSFTRLQQRLSACLAILEMLLFVAPVASKDLTARHVSVQPTQTITMMSYDTDAMLMNHHMLMIHHMNDLGHMMSGDEGFACGYCELPVYVPLIVWAAVPLTWLMLLIARVPPPCAIPLLRRSEPRVYRSRAPPFR